MTQRLKIAVAGCGNWGKNHVRSLLDLPEADLALVCDASEKNLSENIDKRFTGKRTTNFGEVLRSDVEAIVIATPVPTHYELAREALRAGKHVLVEKPLCLKSSEAEELCRIAADKSLKLMVGHLMYFHPNLKDLKSRIDRGEFGKIYIARCERLNIGVIRSNENAWESLAPHDLSILLWLLGDKLETISVNGNACLQPGIEDCVSADLHFKTGELGQITVSWLDPVKTRRVTVVGEKKMAVLNDVPGGGLDIFNVRVVHDGKCFDFERGSTERIPLSDVPALKLELQHFIECVQNDQTPITDGQNGLTVLRWLEQGNRQLQEA